jgi:hypothetical protein
MNRLSQELPRAELWKEIRDRYCSRGSHPWRLFGEERNREDDIRTGKRKGEES